MAHLYSGFIYPLKIAIFHGYDHGTCFQSTPGPRTTAQWPAGRWKKWGKTTICSNQHILSQLDIHELWYKPFQPVGQGQTRIFLNKKMKPHTSMARHACFPLMFHLFFNRWHQFISIPHGKFAICSVDGFTHQKPRRWTKIHEQGQNAHNSFKMFQYPHLADWSRFCFILDTNSSGQN